MSDLHIGEGCVVPYNGTDDCYSVQNLVAAIDYVNTVLVPQQNVSLVMISGDMTSSSYPTQWPKVKALLDRLTVPYLPAIGNHDIWPYDKENGTWEAPYPNGDALFSQTFADVLQSSPWVTNYSGTEGTWNPVHNCTSQFQNWEAVLTEPSTGARLMFLSPDFNTRDHAVDPTERGVMPYVEHGLSNFTGGTLQWLQDRLHLAALSPSKPDRLFMFHHQPYRCPWYVPDFAFCFAFEDKIALKSVLTQDWPVEAYWGAFTGHTHLYQNLTAFDDWPTFRLWETSACKGDALASSMASSVTTATFLGTEVVSIVEHWRNSSTGVWTVVQGL